MAHLTVRVYRNGVEFMRIDNPYNLAPWLDQSSLPSGEFTLDVADTKAWKEDELRDRANDWYKANIREFEGVMVQVKNANQLTPEEQTIRTQMADTRAKLINLVGQVRASGTAAGAMAVVW